MNLGTKLIVDGYLYLRSRRENGKTYWDCRRLRKKECKARAITYDGEPGDVVTVLKGPEQSEHSHPPDREECEAELIKARIKRKADEHPEEPPARILRTELQDISDGVRSHLPDRENLKKSMRRIRRRNLPPNPKSLDELDEIPERFSKTSLSENFLIFDSNDNEARVIVFGTRRNVELLGRSYIWFLDGTFKVAPHIFTQVFTILGIVRKAPRRLEETSETEVAFPYVYALLSSKRQQLYTTVLTAVVEAAQRYNIEELKPEIIMMDFEKSIINSCEEVFPGSTVKCCFFHLGQSVYRKVQEEGLQQAYNNAEDRSIKEYTHMLLALAYVPVEDVKSSYRILKAEAPKELSSVFEYFNVTYIAGKPKRGRTAAVQPRYQVELWNQFEATLQGRHRTNNVSEGWHNRFRLLVGKNHPDLYSLLMQFQEEQADTESMLADLSVGKNVKAAPKKKWLMHQNRLRTIAEQYHNYKREKQIVQYLKAVSSNILL